MDASYKEFSFAEVRAVQRDRFLQKKECLLQGQLFASGDEHFDMYFKVSDQLYEAIFESSKMRLCII